MFEKEKKIFFRLAFVTLHSLNVPKKLAIASYQFFFFHLNDTLVQREYCQIIVALFFRCFEISNVSKVMAKKKLMNVPF